MLKSFIRFFLVFLVSVFYNNLIWCYLQYCCLIGTDEERGINKWGEKIKLTTVRDEKDAEEMLDANSLTCYDLPFGMSFIKK